MALLQPAYPPEFIKKLNGLLAAGSNGIGEIVPPTRHSAD